MEERAYLRVRDPLGTFTCGSALQAVAWLDPDTVLVSAATLRGPSTGRRTLVTWDLDTGVLLRVSSISGGASYDVATMVLGD